MEDARAGGGRWDWVVVLSPWACSASSRRRWGGGSATPARHSTQHCWAASPGCPLFPPQSSAGYYFMKKSEGNLSRGEESRWKERKIWGSGDRERRGGETRDRAREGRPALAPHSPRRPPAALAALESRWNRHWNQAQCKDPPPPSAPHSKRAANAPATCTAAAHERSARSLSYVDEPCSAVEWRMKAHGLRHGLLEGLVRVGVAQQEGDERAAQVLGRVKATPAWRLSTALDDLGPASRGAEPSDVLVFFISASSLMAR